MDLFCFHKAASGFVSLVVSNKRQMNVKRTLNVSLVVRALSVINVSYRLAGGQ